MKFSLVLTFSPPEHYLPLAELTEECEWDSVNVGDGLFFYDQTSVDYPYSDTGDRYWGGDTPFLDPWVSIPAMAMRTKKIRFWSNVLKLPVRNPLLVAKTVSTAAVVCDNRVALGVGLSPWPEDFQVCGEEWSNRGPRCAEMIHIIREALKGEMFEYHGKYYDIPRLQISPVPSEPVPIYIGGTVEPVLKRAARIADGFVSPNTTADKIDEMVKKINRYRAEYGRDRLPFEMISVAIDTFDLDGHRRLEAMGVTEACVVPWFFYGGGFDSALEFKKDAVRRFTDTVIAKMR
jgi:alkanesulfonate monooxygenase SsuD/methylene tetrahydromethanopterin reductase-like flavin-dependent oxidoreductase (luciferase family)